MVAFRRVYDSRQLQADCQEPGSAPEPYARQSSTGYLDLFYVYQTVIGATAETEFGAFLKYDIWRQRF